jgi:hypothetical protein
VETGAPLDIVRERLDVSSMEDLILRKGGGYYQGDGAGGWVAKHLRGSDGHLAAEARHAVILPVLPPVVSTVDLNRAEAELGHRLPGLLRRLYHEVANGGFGPGYGLLGIGAGGHTDDVRKRARVDADRSQAAGRPLLRVCDHGCGIATLLDMSGRTDDLWIFDPNRSEEDELRPDGSTLAGWLEAWVEGGASTGD